MGERRHFGEMFMLLPEHVPFRGLAQVRISYFVESRKIRERVEVKLERISFVLDGGIENKSNLLRV